MALESFYEESARNLNEKKQTIIYNVLLVVQIVFIALSCLWGWIGFNFVIELPINGKTFGEVLPSWILFFLLLASLIGGAVACSLLKKRFNVSYDYLCVYGELRVSKVINQRRRRLICRIDPNSVIQVGDMESDSYDRLRKLPGLKEIVCTPNYTAGSGKFFMYIYAQVDGEKKLYLLECREALLINLMQYLRRDVLDREYIPQDKKM